MTKSYSQLREKWAFELCGKDPSAIESQISSMTWDFASYEVLAKALSIAPREADNSIRRSGLLFQLLERSFSHRVLLFTRRMVDLNSDSISMVRTLHEMERHWSTMTRIALIEGDGLVYDYEPIRQQFYEWLSTQGNGAFSVPESLHWERHEERHKFIDRITGANASARSPSDAIPKKFFTNLRMRAEAAGAIAKTFVDSHLAHAGKPQSRILKGADNISLSFADLRKSLRTFCEVLSIIRLAVLWQSSYQWLAFPLDDQFAYIEQPVVEDSQIGELRSEWSAIEQETQEWAAWGLEEYEIEFAADPH